LIFAGKSLEHRTCSETLTERAAPGDVAHTRGDLMAHRWYTVHAYSNFEKKVKEEILEQASRKGLLDKFEQIEVPSESTIEIRRGKKVPTDKKLLPGYILVKMQMDDDAYHLVKNTQRVVGFLGPEGRPSPVPQSEVDRLMNTVAEGEERPRSTIIYEIGEQVKVTDGPFDGFSGMVEDVDTENERLKVAVSIFGRATPVELEYTQVQKESA
jgi:transcriptional antiterminator NusG